MPGTMTIKPIDQVNKIGRRAFQKNYFKANIPVVLEDMANSWRALSRWTPEMFRDELGHKLVKVYDADFVNPGKSYMSDAKQMPLSDYVEQVMTTRQDLRMFLYNIKAEMPELLDDIDFPDLADGFSKHFVFMFFGCIGSVTQMHFDIDMSHVFHTNLHGKRTVTLFPFNQSKNLHRYPFTCRSYVDVHNPDYERFPNLRQAEGYRVTLEPGQTLFIPSGYWHHIVYDEPGYALSLRCANPSLLGKLHGLYNLVVMQGVDRLMNRMNPDHWHRWKEARALTSTNAV